jgi:predicted nucleic acid-binding protein
MQSVTQLLIINDADAIIALVNEDDASHMYAVAISQKLTELNAKVLTPVTAVIEAITALKRVIDRPDLAKVIVDASTSGNIPTIDVPADILPEAITFFNPDGSKKDTMFDAVVATMAKRYKADAIFSFHQGYKKTGIPLILELLKI